VLRESKVQQEMMELLAHKVCRAYKGELEIQVRRELPEHRAFKA
jgi:hypothetical protein